MVPMKMLEEMQRQQQQYRPRLPVSPQVAQTVDLQTQMQNVLQDPTLSESEKAQQYGETLYQFQRAHQKAKTPSVTPTSSSTSLQSSTTPLRGRILESVPPTLQRKAKLMMEYLQDHPKVSWDEKGELSYAGQRIPGSNIIDLVNDVLRSRKKSSLPTGWDRFAQVLKDVNLPQEVVGNKQRWTWMQKQQAGMSPKSVEKEAEEEEEEGETFYDTSPLIKKDNPSKSSSVTEWEPYHA